MAADGPLIDAMARAIANAHSEVATGEPVSDRDYGVGVIAHKAAAVAALEAYHSAQLGDEEENVARALWHSDVEQFADFPLADWDKVEDYAKQDYRRQARAALAEMTERQGLAEENDWLLGEINDLLSILASRGYTVDKDASLARNVRPYLLVPPRRGRPHHIKVCGAVPDRPMWEGEFCVLPPGHGPRHERPDNPGTVHRAVRDDGLSQEFWTYPEGYEPPPLSGLIGLFSEDAEEKP